MVLLLQFWLVIFILAWSFHTKISIFCNIGKIFKTSKTVHLDFFPLQSFPLIVWDDLCNYSPVLFWGDQEKITVTRGLEGGGSSVVAGQVPGWTPGHKAEKALLLGPCYPGSSQLYSLVCGSWCTSWYCQKLSGNGFILWSGQYFVIYDHVNGRKGIKCIQFFCLSFWSMHKKSVAGSGAGGGRQNILRTLFPDEFWQ